MAKGAINLCPAGALIMMLREVTCEHRQVRTQRACRFRSLRSELHLRNSMIEVPRCQFHLFQLLLTIMKTRAGLQVAAAESRELLVGRPPTVPIPPR
jgi:hypothetical protein